MRSRFLFSLLLLVFASQASAVVHQRSPLATDRERAGYLLFIQKHIPSILEKAQSSYTMPLFTALEREEKYIKFLAENSSFQGLEPGKPELLALTIERL